ncbi:hypothetical protein DY000_02035690 [Brassica cretica]|uniref:Ferritin n=1 Tax=Brassica cretica TaxID=69181 RepID=A0ABQ7DQ58_BRACR|nr:hypothetical protein DY000_02035690 [Brassica cretica]
MTIAQKGGSSSHSCGLIYKPKNGKCNRDICQAECTKERNGIAACMGPECVCSVEYNLSYVYHAMYAYFDRDNVALKGLAKFFKESSVEEREHAEKLMEYQASSSSSFHVPNMSHSVHAKNSNNAAVETGKGRGPSNGFRRFKFPTYQSSNPIAGPHAHQEKKLPCKSSA